MGAGFPGGGHAGYQATVRADGRETLEEIVDDVLSNDIGCQTRIERSGSVLQTPSDRLVGGQRRTHRDRLCTGAGRRAAAAGAKTGDAEQQ
jgi:hypothetical protein